MNAGNDQFRGVRDTLHVFWFSFRVAAEKGNASALCAAPSGVTAREVIGLGP
jgi:hypothetical protein